MEPLIVAEKSVRFYELKAIILESQLADCRIVFVRIGICGGTEA